MRAEPLLRLEAEPARIDTLRTEGARLQGGAPQVARPLLPEDGPIHLHLYTCTPVWSNTPVS